MAMCPKPAYLSVMVQEENRPMGLRVAYLSDSFRQDKNSPDGDIVMVHEDKIIVPMHSDARRRKE
jgi:hypothetical protein